MGREARDEIAQARILCKGKPVAVVGGQTPLAWAREMEPELGTIIQWYPCRRGHRVDGYDGLATKVRDNSVAAVVQIRWSPHVRGLKDLCKRWGVPYARVEGGRGSVLRALAMLAVASASE